MPQLVSRFAAVALIVALLPLTYLGAACAGWTATAADRMACCQRNGHSCGSVDADDCCADGEHRQNVEKTASVLLLPARAAVSTPPFTAPGTQLAPDRRSPPVANRPHVYLLDSVFLI